METLLLFSKALSLMGHKIVIPPLIQGSLRMSILFNSRKPLEQFLDNVTMLR